MTASIRVRFAPSPTGALHLGNVRTALMNWLFARHHAGTFVLRLDDTDTVRSHPDHVRGILTDLRWLGLDWDETFAQSTRTQRYSQVIDQLKSSGALYACWETAQELHDKREKQLAQGLPPVYDRQSLLRPQDFDQTKPAHWRFKLADAEVAWQDLVQGDMRYHTQHLSDPVVVREDGGISYMLSSVIDDWDWKISHILRGCDHLTNTAMQIQMFQALGAEAPQFGHFPLMLDSSGSKVSKRAGSASIADLRQEGLWAESICKALAEFGCSLTYGTTLEAMARDFDVGAYSKASASFGPEWIVQRQVGILQALSWPKARQKLVEMHPGLAQAAQTVSPALWGVVAPCLTDLQQILVWQDVCTNPEGVELTRIVLGSREALGERGEAVEAGSGTDGCLAQAALDTFSQLTQTLADAEPIHRAVDQGASGPMSPDQAGAGQSGADSSLEPLWDETFWPRWIEAILAAHPRFNKKTLCMTLRLILTGQAHGPKMHQLLPLMDRGCVGHRLANAARKTGSS